MAAAAAAIYSEMAPVMGVVFAGLVYFGIGLHRYAKFNKAQRVVFHIGLVLIPFDIMVILPLRPTGNSGIREPETVEGNDIIGRSWTQASSVKLILSYCLEYEDPDPDTDTSSIQPQT
ncbi:hypothetical protein N7478_002219 [Penicillium angulare]|uniref:uncharacterized protein n=1 Tax=Penicillium angulare TaxID=116970 RepID=UPI002541F4D3|nr:uncharacterized protein N7478_002219 [Penicillium angulare]KAJ5289189.1 hypothetical protein N7478_002219 [Penicillium angulare]